MSSQTKILELNQTFKKVLDACPEIVYVGDRVLREKTRDVDLKEGAVISQKLIDVLKRYRAITGFGRGLAAPQIGENKSVFVTFVDDHFETYLNPKIIECSDEFNLFIESCLSCGHMSADVKRPERVTIEYQNEGGETKTVKADGFLARLLQHEHDHLLGIVNIDKAEKGTIQFMIGDPLTQKLRKI